MDDDDAALQVDSSCIATQFSQYVVEFVMHAENLHEHIFVPAINNTRADSAKSEEDLVLNWEVKVHK